VSVDHEPIFIGIARQVDADRYLGGVARREVVDTTGGTDYASRPGQTAPGAPSDRRIWRASAHGPGPATHDLADPSGTVER